MAYGKTIGFLRCSTMTRYLDLSRQLGRLQAGLCIAATQRRRSAGGDGGRLSAAFFFSIAFFGTHALAVEPIVIGPDDERIDITLLGEFYDRRGDKLSVETAPSADGIVGRMTVSAKTAGTNPSWVVFALSNPTDKPVLRWLTAQRYDVVGSHVIKPDLDAPRITNVTPSLGFRPERNEDYDYLMIISTSIGFRSSLARRLRSSWNWRRLPFRGFTFLPRQASENGNGT